MALEPLNTPSKTPPVRWLQFCQAKVGGFSASGNHTRHVHFASPAGTATDARLPLLVVGGLQFGSQQGHSLPHLRATGRPYDPSGDDAAAGHQLGAQGPLLAAGAF